MTDNDIINKEQFQKDLGYVKATAFFRAMLIPAVVVAFFLFFPLKSSFEDDGFWDAEAVPYYLVFGACLLVIWLAIHSKIVKTRLPKTPEQYDLDKDYNEPNGLNFRDEYRFGNNAIGNRVIFDKDNRKLLFKCDRKTPFIKGPEYIRQWNVEWSSRTDDRGRIRERHQVSIETSDFDNPVIVIGCVSKANAQELSSKLSWITTP